MVDVMLGVFFFGVGAVLLPVAIYVASRESLVPPKRVVLVPVTPPNHHSASLPSAA